MTQPGAVRYDKEKVSGNTGRDAFEEYVILKDRTRIDERINEQKSIMEEWKRLKGIKEGDLRCSKDLHDRIYTYFYLDRLSLTQIERRIPYSRVQIWRILKIIKKNCDSAPWS